MVDSPHLLCIILPPLNFIVQLSVTYSLMIRLTVSLDRVN